MTTAEKYEELETKSDEIWKKRERILKAWADAVAQVAYPQDPSKIHALRATTRNFSEDKDYFSIDCRLGDYANLTLSPGRDFRLSTTGYGYFKDESTDVLDVLKKAGEMHSLLLALISSDSWYNCCKEKYTEMVLRNPDYLKVQAESQDIYTQQNEAKKQIAEEDRIKREQDSAAKRVVGTILELPGRRFGAHEDLGLVTSVTPTKIRIEFFSFYDEVDDEGKTTQKAADKGLKYIQKNAKLLIENKRGSFVKNERLGEYKIFDTTK